MGFTLDTTLDQLSQLPLVPPNTPDPNVTIGSKFPIKAFAVPRIYFWDSAGSNAKRVNQLSIEEDIGSDTQVWVTLSQDPGETATVSLANGDDTKLEISEIGGSVGAGLADFTAGSNGTWNVRSTSHSFKVQPIEDNSDDDAEVVNILATGSGGSYEEVSNIFQVRIADDEARIVTDKDTIRAIEGTVAELRVKLSGQPYGNVTVTLSSGDTTAVEIFDPPNRQLIFTTSNWDTYQVVDLEMIMDPDLVDEVVIITLSGAVGGYTNAPNKTVSVVTLSLIHI